MNDLLSQSGWNLNALQRPAAVHMCLTAANAGSVPRLLQGAQWPTRKWLGESWQAVKGDATHS